MSLRKLSKLTGDEVNIGWYGADGELPIRATEEDRRRLALMLRLARQL